jgi:hypothetical protein
VVGGTVRLLAKTDRSAWGIAPRDSLFVTTRVAPPIGTAVVCALGAALVLAEIGVRCFRRA